MDPHKVNIINTLKLLASIEMQDRYFEEVPNANVANELVNQWFDDSFFPEFDWFRSLFTEKEWAVLLEFSNYYEDSLDKLPDTYEAMRESEVWAGIVESARSTLDKLGWRELDASYE